MNTCMKGFRLRWIMFHLFVLVLILDLSSVKIIQASCGKVSPKPHLDASRPSIGHVIPVNQNNYDKNIIQSGAEEVIKINGKAHDSKLGAKLVHSVESLYSNEELNMLRLEYNKYKIIAKLGINTNPDLITHRFSDNHSSLLKHVISRNLPQSLQEYDTNDIQLRPKRSTFYCKQDKNHKDSCCVENFYVNFTEIGWDRWILSPSGYYANYCRGGCDLSNARYYHSTLLNKFSNIIGLCCSPRQMAPLDVLYIDEDNKVYQKSMSDMIVESCDCA